MLTFSAEVAVVGLGRSGLAAARLLRSWGTAVYASDGGTGGSIELAAAELVGLGASCQVGGHDLDRIGRAELVVISPGVPPTAPVLVRAAAAGVPVWAEVELGLRALGGSLPYIAVTGTNGKTTTTALVEHLLLAAGRQARAVGNIGTPLTEIALDEIKPEVLAIELSSFQLHDMPTVAPTVGLLTNLAPDHLDRYANLTDYYGDKARLFANATARSVWVSNADDPESERWISGVAGRRLTFSLERRADGWYDRSAKALMLGASVMLDRAEFPLLGDHNVANALAASLAAGAVDVSMAALAEGLRTVQPLKHRMEPLREVQGVLWINDSKATNVSSTEVAVKSMDRQFVLLLGGRHKGEPYTRLGPLLGRCRAVIAYGEAGPQVVADLADLVRVIPATGFDQVVRTASSLVTRGDAVLLSPACSSYDMFTNYEERGNRFREIVEAM